MRLWKLPVCQGLKPPSVRCCSAHTHPRNLLPSCKPVDADSVHTHRWMPTPASVPALLAIWWFALSALQHPCLQCIIPAPIAGATLLSAQSRCHRYGRRSLLTTPAGLWWLLPAKHRSLSQQRKCSHAGAHAHAAGQQDSKTAGQQDSNYVHCVMQTASHTQVALMSATCMHYQPLKLGLSLCIRYKMACCPECRISPWHACAASCRQPYIQMYPFRQQQALPLRHTPACILVFKRPAARRPSFFCL